MKIITKDIECSEMFDLAPLITVASKILAITPLNSSNYHHKFGTFSSNSMVEGLD